MKHILKCISCGNYTLKEKCKCGCKAVTPKPAKYTPEDKYGNYRREAKKDNLIKKGLL
ncbi:ribosome biogenesis protein [Candidatus Woesearchaeota archaeon CG_4_10_14_0_2_um_filter_33_10]|nr:MAG: ribosome biogenesis protein [Candidatus Woesearchaeota archaeon CG1_02_33_12]PIN77577.1 MAG: ribosome biogenesis protein [Candidatus Woesearchaeota archaeon CG10_big_fil_rev_8_21_14_0_10_33_12]PIU72463.1 MAG: ribosome biogenesis protein [Candidatus Woesearchaeota archaeon CG06_land_8_20_14_3_00_33_13]PIZ53448.1 MAG: ribosome biogenesis protein [Candidatus Woesearchaeota archaeon CG_4_10_14_0_2_um_filter_33_10]